ncbi:MAG: 2-hydroxy-3-oxopropionate reductase [Gammaproteobacteria bacterium]
MSDIKVGFVGLGIMGRPMAINLLKAGYDVWIYARREESMAPVADAGGEKCSSPRQVAEQADVAFTMVSDTGDVEDVILGGQGIIHGARKDAVVVDMSTISPSATRSMAAALAAHGVHMLDAPVSGGDKGAIDGTLSIMVGGKPEIFERVRPLFEVMGKNIVHTGDNGAGQVTKACNQVVIAQTIAAVGEAMILAKASGVDPARVRDALLGGFAGSRVLEVHGQRMIDGNYDPGFKAVLHKKDMRIVLEAANELGIALPGAASATQLVNALVGTGKGELDSAAISLLQQEMSGVKLA